VLPVAVRGMVARAEGAAAPAALRLWPERLAGPGERPSAGLAQAGARYGDVTVFLVGDGAFVEPGGLWVRPGRAATLVVGRDGGGAVRLRLRNAPVENRVRIEVGRWRETWTLAPEEEREILVPAPTGARRPVVSIAAERGFRPSEVDPASEDHRGLGCRVEVAAER